MNMQSRNHGILQDYNEGMDVSQLSRSYGIGERRILQILESEGAKIRPRQPGQATTISQRHVKIGLHLYEYRISEGLDPTEAAEKLGWSMIKMRKVEKGASTLELLDLIDISAYTKTPIEELISV